MASLSSPRSCWPLGTFGTTMGTKLWLLALSPAIPLAIVANCFNFGPSWVFFSSLLGLALLSERAIFLTQQVVCRTGPAVSTIIGLVNATLGNVPELTIAIFALYNQKIDVVKYYLSGSIISNLLLLLGVSLYHGGIVKVRKLQKYDKRQATVNSYMLLLALLCHLLSIPFRINAGATTAHPENLSLLLSIASSITMLIIYFGSLVFQPRKKYNQSSEILYVRILKFLKKEVIHHETRMMSLWSRIVWLVAMIALTVLLSKYVVDTIEDASNAWIHVNFLSMLLSTVGNVARHKGDTTSNFPDKMLNISFSVALDSATQVSTFVVPLCVNIAWIMGIKMDLNFNLPQTGFLTLAIVATALPLQGWLPSFPLKRESNGCVTGCFCAFFSFN